MKTSGNLEVRINVNWIYELGRQKMMYLGNNYGREDAHGVGGCTLHLRYFEVTRDKEALYPTAKGVLLDGGQVAELKTCLSDLIRHITDQVRTKLYIYIYIYTRA